MNAKHRILLVGIGLLLVCSFVGPASGKIISADDNGNANFTVTTNQTQTLASVINNGNGGWFDLNPDVTYTGSVTINYDTGIRGHGATIDLMGGYITVNGCILDIDNCTIKNGSGYKKGALYYEGRYAGGIISNNSIISNTCSGIYSDSYPSCLRKLDIINNNISYNHRGIYSIYNSNSNITKNIIKYNDYGIYLYTASPDIIKNNISNNSCGIYAYNSEPTIKANIIILSSEGISCDRDSSPIITNNTIILNSNGITCDSSSSPSINYNNIYNNTAFGVKNSGTNTINATLNWGGNCTGPKCFENPDGTGDTVTDYVDYEPWLLSPFNENQPPTANFSYLPEKPIVGETTIFNASNSTDPDGNIITYRWDFDDGNTTDTTEVIITHSYASEGDYTINLTVTDDDGATNSTSKMITITPRGDLNHDGYITPADAAIALQIAVGSRPCDAAMLAAADMNNDGMVTSLDALMILQAAAGGIEIG
jgi:parallel beta-helix repeat protein